MMEAVTLSLPVSEEKLQSYCEYQNQDPVCSQVKEFCRSGWPDKTTKELRPYWEARNSLTLTTRRLLLYDNRIVIPQAQQKETLLKIHQGHQGIQKCRLRARAAVWWPGWSRDVSTMVNNCHSCSKQRHVPHEPMLATPLPEYPWQKVGSDFFQIKNDHYLLLVDYFSRYPEVVKLVSTTSACVIAALKSIFARHGIPEKLISDNGPQYDSDDFREFAAKYQIQHDTSSPYYPQGNAQAERTVQTVKNMLIKSEDPYLALLTYRATPLPWCNLSPAELLMGRRLRTTLPILRENLDPQWTYLESFKESNQKFKERQKRDYDQRHRVPDLPEDTNVWVSTRNTKTTGTVLEKADTPRSYVVETPTGSLRRNRRHLSVQPESEENVSAHAATPSTTTANPELQHSPIMTRSRTGTVLHPPERLYH